MPPIAAFFSISKLFLGFFLSGGVYLWALRGLTDYNNSWNEEYDFIIVGAGAAGSVLANRLSENPKFSVLLLESGGSENHFTDIPFIFPMWAATPIDYKYLTEPQTEALHGFKSNQIYWTGGRVLGGSTVHNDMIYIRGNPEDFDVWEKHGSDGWSFDKVLPYFLKSEDNQNEKYLGEHHQSGGLLTISDPRYVTDFGRAWLAAGQEMGYSIGDVNCLDQFKFTLSQLTQRDGRRCSTSKAFLDPAKMRPNLHIVPFARVDRILIKKVNERDIRGNNFTNLIDDKSIKAVGVSFTRLGRSYQIYSRKEVILSAGALNTPKILMLSGIGPRDHLQELGIPVYKDLPVGQNLMDHLIVPIFFRGKTLTLNP